MIQRSNVHKSAYPYEFSVEAQTELTQFHCLCICVCGQALHIYCRTDHKIVVTSMEEFSQLDYL